MLGIAHIGNDRRQQVKEHAQNEAEYEQTVSHRLHNTPGVLPGVFRRITRTTVKGTPGAAETYSFQQQPRHRSVTNGKCFWRD